ncbi:MAG: hypothetical protein RMX26_08470 [Planktomarina sp.]|nr:hypothetical protein [Planktomarina sp.]
MSERKGLWHNIRKKRARMAKGSGEKMRKPGAPGAPTAQAIQASQVKPRRGGLMG